MNYRHGYHAGNFADVFKHIILVYLLQALSRKEKPFCYLETHAGRGQYDLFSEFPQKSREYTRGIARIMATDSDDIPPVVAKYREIVSSFQYPHYYPGSPVIARSLLRKSDRMALMEYHPDEFEYLAICFKGDKQAGLHNQDGYIGLNALVPPKERRGLILIDPPFEDPLEWEKLIQVLRIALKKFSNGVYAIWYPIKNQSIVNTFLNSLSLLSIPEILVAELSIYPNDSVFSLIGCGLAIINPPWQLDEELRPVVSWVWKALSVNGTGNHAVRFL